MDDLTMQQQTDFLELKRNPEIAVLRYFISILDYSVLTSHGYFILILRTRLRMYSIVVTHWYSM